MDAILISRAAVIYIDHRQISAPFRIACIAEELTGEFLIIINWIRSKGSKKNVLFLIIRSMYNSKYFHFFLLTSEIIQLITRY